MGKPRPAPINRPPITVDPDQPAAPPEAIRPIDGDGVARGCRLPGSVKITGPGFTKEVGGVLPSWVQATPSPRDRGPQPDRLVEGILAESRISGTDFPLRPWHRDYDWNLFVRPDRQYRNLLSASNVNDNRGLLECEWETTHFPSWAWPQQGQRVWLLGRWIFDCGHQYKHGHRTEIHPPKALVSFRSEAFTFIRMTAPVRANQAVLYINGDGGYWRSPINDRDYEFDLPLPPRPSAKAVPVVQVQSKTGRLPVRPVLTPKPTRAGGVVKVKIPLKGLSPAPPEYGAIISCGWNDPTGADAGAIVRTTVSVDKIFMDANLDRFGNDEWYVYAGINGRWKVLKSLSGDSASIRHAVTLDLHPTDQIRISVCGFEADEVHDLMGRGTSIPPATVSGRITQAQALAAAGTIRDAFVALIFANPGKPNENAVLSPIEIARPPLSGADRITVRTRSPDKNYRIDYTIARVAVTP